MNTDNIYATRRKKGQLLIKQLGSNVAFGNKINRSAAIISSRFGSAKIILNVGSNLARHIERCFNKPEGWMDTPFTLEEQADEIDTVLPTTTHSVPLIAWHDISAFLEKQLNHKEKLAYSTNALSIGAFALTVEGDAMTANQLGEISFPDGAIIFVERLNTLNKKVMDRLNKKPVIVRSNNIYLFSMLSKGHNYLHLKPCNTQYPVRQMRSNDVIIGEVVSVSIQIKK